MRRQMFELKNIFSNSCIAILKGGMDHVVYDSRLYSDKNYTYDPL